MSVGSIRSNNVGNGARDVRKMWTVCLSVLVVWTVRLSEGGRTVLLRLSLGESGGSGVVDGVGLRSCEVSTVAVLVSVFADG